jgi:signal transduction histidine kinase
MSPQVQFAHERPSGTDALLDEQRALLEANERLVLAVVHADEEAEAQREANERLALAVLRAEEEAEDRCEANAWLAVEAVRVHDEVDAALGAQQCAEEDASVHKARATELRATAEDRERLIGMVGHDLRSPLTAIVLAADRMIRRGRLGTEDAQIAARIVSSGQRMAAMVAELIEFTRVRLGGGLHPRPAPANLGAICRDITEELGITSPVEIQCTLAGDLAGSWDATRISEVVSNLACNAVAHATPGTVVRIDVHDVGDVVVAEVTNRGDCISAEEIGENFKAFHRGSSSSTDRGGVHLGLGLGLGLYIASEIVRSHGGTLAVRSADHTTTFALRLPRAVREGEMARADG